MSEWSLDLRVWSPKRSPVTFRGGRGLGAAFGRGVGQEVEVEGTCGNIGDCWKGLRIGSTLSVSRTQRWLESKEC